MGSKKLERLDRKRRDLGLLTSLEICKIRQIYGLTRRDLSRILGLNPNTIYLYEHHRIQNRTRDKLLRKIGQDPLYFLEVLNISRDLIDPRRYKKYKEAAYDYLKKRQKFYLRNHIEISYKYLVNRPKFHGFTDLDIRKIRDISNYITRFLPGIPEFQLACFLWHLDVLSYKEVRKSITGLAYKMHKCFVEAYYLREILDLVDMKRKKVYAYHIFKSYKYYPDPDLRIRSLTIREITILDDLIAYFKTNNIKTIMNNMTYIQSEYNFRETYSWEEIFFDYNLSVFFRIN